MNFYTHQQNARQNTTKFVFLFVVGTVISPILIALGVDYLENGHFFKNVDEYPWETTLIFLAGTLGVVTPIAFFKFKEFKVGGYIIAQHLGGRYLHPQQPHNFQERQLLNIVAEMAIAANIQAPHVYILDEENGINAFAAGYHLNDAVIGVTKGALDVLTREELMALIGHELSHILNEDMRINLRFTAIISGMYSLMILAYVILRAVANSKRSSSNKKDSASGLIFLFALAFMILGCFLYFWGNLLQASISRQREFLADASSAQLTRMPHAVASLLKKIGGNVDGSKINNSEGKAFCHMFFSSSAKQIFATHPPLKQRILNMEPDWDGTFIQPVPLYDERYTQPYSNPSLSPIPTNNDTGLLS